jgi:hypothetical protein
MNEEVYRFTMPKTRKEKRMSDERFFYHVAEQLRAEMAQVKLIYDWVCRDCGKTEEYKIIKDCKFGVHKHMDHVCTNPLGVKWSDSFIQTKDGKTCSYCDSCGWFRKESGDTNDGELTNV